MAGHVFVTQGDLKTLYCDAWLLPSDVGFNVSSGFRGDGTASWAKDLDRLWRGERRPPAGWAMDGVRVALLENGLGHERTPLAFLVNVGRWAGTPASWYMAGVRQFFRAVAAQRQYRVTDRPKPLIAVPLVGTGDGGGVDQQGDLIKALLATLNEAATAYDVDIALVTRGATAFAATQHARRQLDAHASAATPGWPELDTAQRALAANLAERARKGRLVLFLGAGVSMGAGLPSWNALLATLAADAGLDDAQLAALGRLQPADRARIIENRLAAQGRDLGTAICAQLTGAQHSLAHSLLATLPVNEVVTLNYDRLFELASEAADRPVAVLPYQPASGQARWLLKLHGCVRHPRDIVLTREDYLRYADRRAALSGIVQALLITRHMLFVGFSLTDENFQRVVDDVRKALQGADGAAHVTEQFGTALLLRRDPLLEELWEDSVRLAGVADADRGTDAEVARRLDIFLDLLLAEASRGAAPLLNHAYDGILNDEERELRNILKKLNCQASLDLKRAPAWEPVKRLLHELGATSGT